MYIDTHAHIYKEYYGDIDEIISRAKNKGVLKIINCSTNFKNFDEIIALSSIHKNLYFTIGIHPEEIENIENNKIEKYVKECLNNYKFLGIGEIGLDYFYTKENILQQQDLFRFQLGLAQKYNLPVIVHSRNATEDTIKILKEYKLKGIIHCFSGSAETAAQYIKLGFKLGIGGLLTFKNCNLKENIKAFGVGSIVLETDSPYVTPEPFRGKTNEPSYIPIIAKKLSETLGLTEGEIEEITTNNCHEIFDFKV